MSGQKGYTIIEVTLFLAISGALLVIAFAGLSGKQRTTEFSQSMRDIEASINATLNDTQNGYFPTPQNTTCDLSGVGGRPLVHSQSGASLGGGQNCIFLGKVLAFGDDADTTSYQVYTVVGKRGASTDETAFAAPTVAELLTETKTTTWGVHVVHKNSPGGANPSKFYTNVVGVVNGLRDTKQLPALFTAKSFLATKADQLAYINDSTNYQVGAQFGISPQDNPFLPAIICFEGRGGDRVAQIEIGIGGSGIGTKLTFDTCEGVNP